MFSKNVLRKMVQELSVPTLISLTNETLDGIEDLTEDVVSNVEMFAAEMRRRIAGDQPQPVRQRRGPRPKEPQIEPILQTAGELQ